MTGKRIFPPWTTSAARAKLRTMSLTTPPVAFMKSSPWRLFPACALIVLSSTRVMAEPLAKPLDFALHLSRLKTELHAEQQRIDTVVKRAGITSFDSSEPALQPGLLLGYAWTDISNQTLTAGMTPEGFYIGPALRGVMIAARHFTLTVTAGYLYQRVRDSNAGQSVTLEWYQPQLDLDAAWRITRRISVLIGGQYGRIDADEKLTGTVNQTITLSKRPTLGSRAGLELDLGGDGQAGVLIHQAIGDGVELYFQQQF